MNRSQEQDLVETVTILPKWSVLMKLPSIAAAPHPELMGMYLIQCEVAGATLTASSG